MTATTAPRSEKFLILLAFAAVYFLWGSCFLANKIAVETLPPALMLSLRFLSAGVVLYAAVAAFGAPRPTMLDMRDAFVQSMFLLVIANGASAWSASRVPSSFIALLWATIPLWTVLISFFWPGELRPSRRILVSAAVSFVGLIVLVQPWNAQADASAVGATAVVLLAAGGWSLASFLSRSQKGSAPPLLSTALQFLIGGSVVGLFSIGSGELSGFTFSGVSERSWVALAFLAIPGAVAPLSAYAWLLRRVSPARLSTYAYVNPVVAVILGGLFANEKIGMELVLGGGIILMGVVLSITDNSASVPTADEPVVIPATGSVAAAAAGAIVARDSQTVPSVRQSMSRLAPVTVTPRS